MRPSWVAPYGTFSAASQVQRKGADLPKLRSDQTDSISANLRQQRFNADDLCWPTAILAGTCGPRDQKPSFRDHETTATVGKELSAIPAARAVDRRPRRG